jgi:tRNA pseudouridine55 synthase
MDGAVLVDKPVGLSSNAALQKVKKLFGASKAGHAGTLDPLASGLLVVLFGEATKLSSVLLDADKEYVARVKLGEATSTGDAEGEVVETGAASATTGEVAAVLERFRGEIEQVPPMYSALKRDGVPLYKLARRGETVERPARRVHIEELALRAFEPPLLDLRIRCSKGTYVRTLAEDLGRALGTCAHLAALRRTASGGLKLEDAMGLEALETLAPRDRESRIVPLAALLSAFPRADLDPGAEVRFRNGQPLRHEGLAEGLCAVYGSGGSVIGLGFADGAGSLRPVRLTASQPADKHQKNL